MVCVDQDAVEFAAAATILALSTKLQDNIADEKGLRKVVSELGDWVLRPRTTRALVSEPTSHAVGSLFAAGVSGTDVRNAAYDCGHALGRRIYLFDGWEDLTSDFVKGNFNVFQCSPAVSPQSAQHHHQTLRSASYEAVSKFPPLVGFVRQLRVC